MWQGADVGEVFLGQIKQFHRDNFTFFDEFDQFFLCTECDIFAFIHDCNPGTDLFDFFHVVRGVDDRCTGAV